MKRILALALLVCGTIGAAPKKPKLVVAVCFDQLRYDYLTRFFPIITRVSTAS